MQRLVVTTVVALAFGALSSAAFAAGGSENTAPPAGETDTPTATAAAANYTGNIPSAGLSADDVANWLQSEGYKAQVSTNKDGSKSIQSATGGTNFNIDMYDCHDKPTCTAIQFNVGFDTKGAWNATKMNSYNSAKRWVRAYVDDNDDPWLEQDVDLIPGGTWEGLNDQFGIWRQMMGDFEKYINW
jgi:hypothetical protein